MKRKATTLIVKNPAYDKRRNIGPVRPNYQARPRTQIRMPQEVNFVDLAAAAYECSTTGSITLLNIIPQGNTASTRIGKRCFLRSLMMRGFIGSKTTTTIVDTSVLIVYDKRPTGALPAITDILTAITPKAFMNDTNSNRFEVLRRINNTCIGNSTTPNTGNEAFNCDVFIPLKKREMRFGTAGTGLIGDIETGAMYLITLGDVATGSAAGQASLAFRTRFTEQ